MKKRPTHCSDCGNPVTRWCRSGFCATCYTRRVRRNRKVKFHEVHGGFEPSLPGWVDDWCTRADEAIGK